VFELANPIARSAWGKDESILGKTVIEGIPELRGQPFLGYLDDVFRTGVECRSRGELARLVRSESGRLEDVYFDFVYTPLRDRDGSIDGVLVCGFEVTAQIQAAQELSLLLAKAEASGRQFRSSSRTCPSSPGPRARTVTSTTTIGAGTSTLALPWSRCRGGVEVDP
jgi:hypothetical protein